MTISNKPFMTYLEPKQHEKLKKFAALHKASMAQIIRDSIEARLYNGDKYSLGFNQGLKKALQVIQEHKASQMRFPSGKSFAELVGDEIKQHFILEYVDEGSAEKDEPGSTKGATSGKRQTDSDLGV